MTTTRITGDKFPREITEMETGPATRENLIKRGFDGQIYMATRKSRKSGPDMVAMVYRVTETGEFVFATA